MKETACFGLLAKCQYGYKFVIRKGGKVVTYHTQTHPFPLMSRVISRLSTIAENVIGADSYCIRSYRFLLWRAIGTITLHRCFDHIILQHTNVKKRNFNQRFSHNNIFSYFTFENSFDSEIKRFLRGSTSHRIALERGGCWEI